MTTPVSPSSEGAWDLIELPDGKLVTVGHAHTTDWQFAVTRHNANGSLDTTFGSGGSVITPFGALQDVAHSVVAQPDGKLVVGGYTNSSLSDQDFALARYNTDGSLDTSFGTGGLVTTSFGSGRDSGQSVALQSDGKIIVAGYCNVGGYDFAIARYEADGSLDTTFGSGGMVFTPVGTGSDYGYSVLVQPDGKLVLVGTSYNGTDNDLALVRYNADGSLDTSFGTGGKVTTPVGTDVDDNCNEVAIQADGKIVVAGWTAINGNDFAVVRYNPDGSLDTTFGAGGKVISRVGAGDDRIDGMTIQPDGKILVVGRADMGSSYDLAMTRFDADGSLDTGFGSNGRVTLDVAGGYDMAYGVVVRADGKIVVNGNANTGVTYDSFLARYNADGSLDTGFDGQGALDGTPAFVEDGAPVVLDADVIAFDAELSASGNYDGATLTLARNGNASA